MRSAVEFYGSVDQALRDNLAAMRAYLALMPDNGDSLWSCHAATRGFKTFLELPYEVKDGFFARRGVCHSWLETEIAGRKLAIDVLPMGAHGGPFVADISKYAPWALLYIEQPEFYTGKYEDFEREARGFVHSLREPVSSAG